jgi:hypothetical protein
VFAWQMINPLTPELNPSAQRCLTKFLLGILLLEPCISLIYLISNLRKIFLLGILIFKGFTARRFYKSFGVKGLNVTANPGGRVF